MTITYAGLIALTVLFWWLGLFQLLVYLVQMKRVPRPAVFQMKGYGPKRILILGESIALGYGVRHFRDGFAGLIERAFPEFSVDVIALPFKGTGALLSVVPLKRKYDVVILTTSGNDLMVSDMSKIRRDLTEMIDRCAHITQNIVILGNFNNLYRARYFSGGKFYKCIPYLLQRFFEKQGREVKEAYEYTIIRYRSALYYCSAPYIKLVEVSVLMEEGDTALDSVHPNACGHKAFSEPIIRAVQSILYPTK